MKRTGYWAGNIKKVFRFLGIIVGTQFIVSLPAPADTTYVSGIIDTNTVWDTTGNPYIVIGDVIVDTLITLDIEPGVEVRLDSAKQIMVKGKLYAIGTVTDSIIISALDTAKRWSRLWFKPASSCTLKYCRIEWAGNSAIYDEGADSLYIGYNTICNNSTSSNTSYKGGGIWNSGSPTITNNTISNNSANYGGGVYNSGTATISNNTITNNSGYVYGGGIYSSCTATIFNNTITNNSASNGGGIYNEGTTIITNNKISNNFASSGGYPAYGGGISNNNNGTATITNNAISNNSVSSGMGGSSGYGGGIYNNNGTATITNNKISNNSISGASGSIGYGGGIYNNNGTATITNNKISNNSVNSDGSGGGIWSSGTATITNNAISNNYAYFGGDIWGYGSLTIKYNTIINTTSSAIYIYSDSAFIDSNNLYTTGYAVYNNSANDIDARYNYWGTTDSATIANQKIWDFYDNPAKGIVYFWPFLPDTFGVEEERFFADARNNRLEVYPNPSFGNSIIRYGVPKKANISLKLYDISGRLVKTIYSWTQEAGYHEEKLTGEHIGSPLQNGIYFIQLRSDEFIATKKFILLK